MYTKVFQALANRQMDAEAVVAVTLSALFPKTSFGYVSALPSAWFSTIILGAISMLPATMPSVESVHSPLR